MLRHQHPSASMNITRDNHATAGQSIIHTSSSIYQQPYTYTLGPLTNNSVSVVEDSGTEDVEASHYMSKLFDNDRDCLVSARLPEDAVASSTNRKRRRQSTETSAGRRGLDPVQANICSEEIGKSLYLSFFAGCHASMPIYDPEYDTWSSLAKDSPLSLAVILFVAQRINDAKSGPSVLQGRLRAHAESFIRDLIFESDLNLRTIQALVIFASWIENPWRVTRGSSYTQCSL
ncbi:hypothetical protein BD324DRAFT_616868 [Kockovaella imperatae]|uniref:Transcription factor domain-containing protein n=1 Tax=Kockovaella imperatae TaxID=4999 RepID=A0A1Y1URX8_9TREE|nr:hypothetical protein BD324DRAFT_616868 [Kockovaella imperatae]ORX40206.1 hypothetical protein BD324DRAFT_616868 [Kockovaella imperatae]